MSQEFVYEGEALTPADYRREGYHQPFTTAYNEQRSARRRPEADAVLVPPSEIEQDTEPVSAESQNLPDAVKMLLIGAIQADASERYHIHEREGRFETSNPDQHLLASFFPAGVVIEPEAGFPNPWSWRMQLVGIGRGDRRHPLSSAALHVAGNRIEYQRDLLTEWYVNGPLGLEQGFTLHEAPIEQDGETELVLELAFQHGWKPELTEDRQSLLFRAADGQVLRYGHLFVKDASERLLPVHLELIPDAEQNIHQVRILVDDRDAVYPLVVDPLIQQQQTRLTASDGAANDNFGFSVDISGDTVVVGAYKATTNAGKAYVFTRSGTTWSQQQILTGAAGDQFGYWVAIDGNTLVVGAISGDPPGASNAGVAHVYTRSGTVWSLQQTLYASDRIANDGSFGSSVDISGDTIVVGAEGADVAGLNNAGAAYVFTRSGTIWTEQQKLTAGDKAAGDQFGRAVAIDGNSIIVGAYRKNTFTGSAYVFTRSGTVWSPQQTLTANDGAANDNFGIAVTISGDTVIVGAYLADPNGISNAGAAYVFTRTGSVWSFQQKLTASDKAVDDGFGISVAVSANIAVIGAYSADPGGNTNTGAAYVFARNGSVWTQQTKLTATDKGLGYVFGWAAAISGDTTVIGAFGTTIGANSGQGAAYVFTPIIPTPSPNTGGPQDNLSWAGEVQQDGAIALRTAEKVETATDIAVYTMVGALDFTRTYRQAKRATFQFMGLGWQHNHAATLTKIVGTPNTLLIQMPNGGELKLTETTAGSNSYIADGGSDAVVTYNAGTTQYTLVGSDKAQFIFNSTGKLIQRIWPPFGANAANWLYSYDGNGRLISVEDKLDSTTLSGRKLVFAYRSTPGQFDDGQLWRIGDQDTTSLTGTPVGRYVEFGYTPQKNNGVTIASPKALLNTVRDARGNVWTYKYYGQVAGQNNANQLDFMIEILSPSVDTTGDGAADGTLSLESLTYTTSGATITNITRGQGNSAISTDYAFQPSGQNVTTETVAGKTGTHYFNNGVYGGFADPAGNVDTQGINFQYRPEVVQDANAQITQMGWSADGKFLQTVKDALGNTTTYSYNVSGASADTLNFVQDAEGRKTQYTYGDAANPLLPTIIKVLDTNGTTVLRWQTFTYDSKGRMTSAKLLDPANGTTVMQQVDRAYSATPGTGYGLLLTETVKDPITPANDSSTTFTYDSKGRVIKTQKTSMFGCCQFSYTVYDDADLVVATVSSRINQTAPTSKAAAIALFDSADPDKNRITTFDYDTMGRKVLTTVFDGASFAVKELVAYDALGRVIRTIANYVASGSILNPYTAARASFAHGSNVDQNLVTDNFYNSRGMLRKQIDPLDNVTLYGYDDAGRLVKTVQSAFNGNYNNDYTGVSPDPALASYSPNAAVDKDLISSRTYDKAGNLVKTVDALGVVNYTVYDVLNRPVKTVRAAKDTATITLNVGDGGYVAANDPRSASYSPAVEPDRDLIETSEYDKMGRVIRTQRLLDNRPTAEWETTLYGYDGLGRSVKVIKVANTPAYNIAADPTLGSYSASANADVDLVTRTAYDKAERVLFSEDNFGSKTWTGYDGLGRPVKTIVNAVGIATDGSASDPRSGSYVPNIAADKDLVLTTAYNSDGRVLSSTDALGRVTRYVYDTVGRVTRTVQNFIDQAEDPALWVYNNGWKKSNGTTAISHGTDNDQNIVSRTVYDGKGRAVQRIDHRNNVTLTVFDTLDRPIMTVANYIVQGASNPANWVWDSTDNRWEDGANVAISFGSDKDQNRISTVTYDLLGRQLRQRGADGVETRFTVDALGRRTQTIANYVDGIFSAAAPDTDLISTMVYNKGHQVLSTTDVRNTQTGFTYDKVYRRLTVTQAVGTALASIAYTCYDKAGRVQRTIQNWSSSGTPDAKDANGNWTFVPASNGTNSDSDLTFDSRFDKASRPVKRIVNYRAQGTTNPSNWLWSIANNRWENGAGVALSHGTANDQNLIALTSYDKDGQVESMTDADGVVSKHRYDLLRRKTRTVQGFVDQTEDPALWIWDATDNRWEKSSGNVAIAHGTNNDQNIIQLMTYDKGSRLLTQREPRGNVTTFTYDQLNRRKSLSNPLAKVWSTAYTDLAGAGMRQTMTYPGITGFANYTVQQDFDRLGRPLSIQYGAPAVTPDVKMTYDNAGNRSAMSEYSAANFTSRIRDTLFSYDKLHRMTAADFDTNGNGTINETVSYQYDAGGLRTRLSLPTGLSVTYTYDARGRLISLADWDSQVTQLAYDLANRHLTTSRANQLKTECQYDTAGRLKLLKHNLMGSGSFPTTALKDDFNRANSASLGANWGAFFGNANLDVNGNEARNPAADGTSAWAGNYYNVAQYGPDAEAYLTLKNRPTSQFFISARVGGTLSSPNYYGIGWNAGGSGVHRIVRVDNGSETQLGATFNQTLAVNDSIGISVVGSTISAYYKPSGGSWTLLTTRTDTTYSGAGYIAIESEIGGWKCDDFSGGTVVAGSTPLKTFGHFEFKSDRRGNRIEALEALANPATTNDTIIPFNDKGLVLAQTWTEVAGFKESVVTSAILSLKFLASTGTLTLGKGPDHSICGLYLNGSLWQTFDGYNATATQVDLTLPGTLAGEGPHLLEIRNTATKNASSTGFKVRFKQLLVVDKTWNLHTVEYTYDRLMRVLEARYNPGINTAAVDAALLRRYLYTYDRAHNRLTESLALNGAAPTVKTLTYNAANQISSAGYVYDNNGNLTSDGVNSYTWDRANRLLSMGTTSYKYEGGGNRIQQIVGANTSIYVLDLNSRLPTVLAETVGANVTRFVHGPRGLHMLKPQAGVWQHALADALGSMRVVTDNTPAVLESRSYGIYGDLFGSLGTPQTGYGYSGEPTDSNGLVYDRARYMSPAIGQFLSLDPLEVFNRYAYVDGNPVMRTDPSGLLFGASGVGLGSGGSGSVAVKPPTQTTPKPPPPAFGVGFGVGSTPSIPASNVPVTPPKPPTVAPGGIGFGAGSTPGLPTTNAPVSKPPTPAPPAFGVGFGAGSTPGMSAKPITTTTLPGPTPGAGFGISQSPGTPSGPMKIQKLTGVVNQEFNDARAGRRRRSADRNRESRVLYQPSERTRACIGQGEFRQCNPPCTGVVDYTAITYANQIFDPKNPKRDLREIPNKFITCHHQSEFIQTHNFNPPKGTLVQGQFAARPGDGIEILIADIDVSLTSAICKEWSEDVPVTVPAEQEEDDRVPGWQPAPGFGLIGVGALALTAIYAASVFGGGGGGGLFGPANY